MNQDRLNQLTWLVTAYKDITRGIDNRAGDETEDITKAANRLEGLIMIAINQLEQP